MEKVFICFRTVKLLACIKQRKHLRRKQKRLQLGEELSKTLLKTGRIAENHHLWESIVVRENFWMIVVGDHLNIWLYCLWLQHSLWHRFKKLLECHIYFRPQFNSFFTNILNWWWECRTAARSLFQHIPKMLSGVQVWNLWGPIHVWRQCPHASWTTLSQFQPDNPRIIILEYARAIREEKNPLIE